MLHRPLVAMALPTAPAYREARLVAATFARTVRAMLRPVALGLSGLYLLLACAHALLLPQPIRLPMATTAALSAVVLLVVGVALIRWQLPLRWAHPLAAALAGLPLANSVLHLYLRRDPQDSTNVALVIISCGCLLLSWRWYSALVVLAWVGWLGAVLIAPAMPNWTHFGFVMLQSTILSGLIFVVRVQAQAQLARLQARERSQRRALRRAVGVAKRHEAALQRAKDNAEATSRAKSAFLAAMSHELRTPLHTIIGYSTVLQAEAQRNGHADLVVDLQKVSNAGKHLLSLVSNILDLARIEAGRIDVQPTHYDLALLIDEVVLTMHPTVAQQHNVLLVELPSEPGTVYTDATRLRQVLLNLLSNAAKFTQQGTIMLRLEHCPKCHGWLRFTVQDTGIGINSDQLATLFDEFTTGNPELTRKFGGVGLGLALSKRFCQLLGGEINVTSVPGQGTTFTVYIPSRLGEAPLDIVHPSMVQAF